MPWWAMAFFQCKRCAVARRRLKSTGLEEHVEMEESKREKARKEEATVGTGGDAPEAQEQHVVEFVFAERPGHGDEEGLAEERRAGVVVARLLVLLPQVHRDHHMLRVLHPVHRQLEPAPSTPPGPVTSQRATKSRLFQEWSCRKHSHVDVVPLHDAAEVLVGGEDAVEAVVVDVGDDHLPRVVEKAFHL